MSDWQIFKYAELDSTNNNALKLADVGQQKIVIQADQQTAGRGRRGRSWSSLAGNLFFSQVFAFDMKNIGALVIISSLSILQTIKDFFPQADVSLKWPNDVLLNQAKVCGMLIEKGEGNNIIVGIGVNVAQSPENSAMMYPTISLTEAGCNVNKDSFLQKYLQVFDENFINWQQNNISALRQLWESYAYRLGDNIVVRQNGREESGIFGGIDENGNLLLQQNDGIKKIIVGDVFYLGK